MNDFDAKWEAAKRGDPPPPPDGLFDDDAPDVPPDGVEEFGELLQRERTSQPKADTSADMKTALKGALQDVEERAKRKGELAGAKCGLTRLDDTLDGWQRGCLYVVGGRTGMGKSVVGLNVGMGLARNGYGVDFLSLEMPTKQQAMRALLCESGVPHYRIKQGTMRASDWRDMTSAMDRMCKWPWLWDDRGGVTVEWIVEHVTMAREKIRAKGGELHSVVIDHVQKIRGSEPRAPRHEQMKWIVDGLKQLAKREDVCVIALAQINRNTEERTAKDRRPRMANLREAGAVEEEADAVALLYREDYYTPDKDNWTNVLEVNLPKVRGGEPGLVKLRFDGARTRIDNLEDYDQ